MKSNTDLINRLRDRVISGLHLGLLHSGDRLPSIREVVAETGVNDRAVTRAYRALEAEGLVKVRGRSGVYVAEQERLDEELFPETVLWMAGVLSEARKRGLKIPKYHEFVRQCTVAVRVRCAVVESTEDGMRAYSGELEEEWGFDVQRVFVKAEPGAAGKPSGPGEERRLREAFADVDLIATSSFHAAAARKAAALLEKPVVTLTTHPALRAAILRRLEEGELTAVVADARFGERIRTVYGEATGKAAHVRVVLVDDGDAVGTLDPAHPVLLTRAAHESLGASHLPLLFPHSPTISPEADRELAEILIRVNRDA